MWVWASCSARAVASPAQLWDGDSKQVCTGHLRIPRITGVTVGQACMFSEPRAQPWETQPPRYFKDTGQAPPLRLSNLPRH